MIEDVSIYTYQLTYKKLPFVIAIFLYTGISLLFSLGLGEVVNLLLDDPTIFDIRDEGDSLTSFIIEAIVVAPIIETLILIPVLEGIHYLCKQFTKRYADLITIIFCGLLFGLLHWYNVYYIVISALSFAIYSYAYFALKKTHSSIWIAGLGLILIHALDNAVNVYVDYL